MLWDKKGIIKGPQNALNRSYFVDIDGKQWIRNELHLRPIPNSRDYRTDIPNLRDDRTDHHGNIAARESQTDYHGTPANVAARPAGNGKAVRMKDPLNPSPPPPFTARRSARIRGEAPPPTTQQQQEEEEEVTYKIAAVTWDNDEDDASEASGAVLAVINGRLISLDRETGTITLLRQQPMGLVSTADSPTDLLFPLFPPPTAAATAHVEKRETDTVEEAAVSIQREKRELILCCLEYNFRPNPLLDFYLQRRHLQGHLQLQRHLRLHLHLGLQVQRHLCNDMPFAVTPALVAALVSTLALGGAVGGGVA